MKVPFVDLKANYISVKDEIEQAITKVLENTAFASGPFVEEFENNFAEFTSKKHCVAVNSGTSALHLSAILCGIGPGDEVILPAHTFVSTAWAVSYVGAKPVFVDIDPMTYTIDPDIIEENINNNTKAIIPVHLYGQAVKMDPIYELRKKYGIKVIEDAAQAQGTLYNKYPVGKNADFTCYSFYPGKNLGAFGEGGAITTDNDDYATKLRQLRNHGQPKKYIHTDIGYNYRMDGIQGAVLNVKLKYIEKWNEARRKVAHKYGNAFRKENSLIHPFEPKYSQSIYHLYELKLNSKALRDSLLEYLKGHQIFAGLHYPVPIHLQKAYNHLGYSKGDLPETEKAADQLISLPMFPEIMSDQVEYVIENVLKFAKDNIES